MPKFGESEKLLERALKVIPNGTQTFSKSRTQYPVGMAPLYIEKGKGSHVWDADGNEFIDFVAGLGAIILGYHDVEVDLAVLNQMAEGAIFSLPHRIEIEVAEKLCNLIPCAEMVRFGKNGSDATSGAVRLARYVTKRDHVLTCEGHYHGWQDWFNGISARNGGVPEAVKKLTHTFKYNDLDSVYTALKTWDTACLIMEPMTSYWPLRGFLEEIKEMCDENGTIFVFDEMLTGFRFAPGGAQEYFGVTPDLACFGKAMANGYPISAVVGKAEIMRKMEEIHFSFTFGGDCVAMAAAKATIDKLKRVRLPEIHHLLLSGHPCRPKWDFSHLPKDAKNKIFQECYQNGILVLDNVNMTASHTEEECNKLISVVENAVKDLDQIELQGHRIENQFQVRA